MFALRRAGKQECGDVGAGDEKQQRNRAIEEPEVTAHSANDDFFEGRGLDGKFVVGLGELLAELVLYGEEVGGGLLNRGVGLEAADHCEPGSVTALGERRI